MCSTHTAPVHFVPSYLCLSKPLYYRDLVCNFSPREKLAAVANSYQPYHINRVRERKLLRKTCKRTYLVTDFPVGGMSPWFPIGWTWISDCSTPCGEPSKGTFLVCAVFFSWLVVDACEPYGRIYFPYEWLGNILPF